MPDFAVTVVGQEIAVEVVEAPIEVVVSGAAGPVTIELANYTDANVRAFLLSILSADTALGRLGAALAALSVMSSAEGIVGTLTTPRIVDAVKLKATILGLADALGSAAAAQAAAIAASDPVGSAAAAYLAAVGDLAAHVAAANPHSQYALASALANYQLLSGKNSANGYAGLDASSLLSVSHLGLSASGAFPYRTAAGAIGASLQGTVPLGAYAVDWAAGDMFTKPLAGGDTFTHSNEEAKIAITIRVTNSGGHAVPGGIGTRNPGTSEWDTAWTTVDIYLRKVSGALVYTLSGE